MELALSFEKLTNEKLLNLHQVANQHNDVQLPDFVESEFLTEQSKYRKYTPLFAKILEGLLSQSNFGDKIRHKEVVAEAASEVIDSVDQDELAKFFSQNSDPEDEEAEKIKKKMETTRDQLAEALYQKGLALAEIEALY